MQSFYQEKRILIPGGAGFIGSRLAISLIRFGARVTIVDSFERYCGSNSYNLKEVEKDISIFVQRIETFARKEDLDNYDIIFNCTGLTNHHIGFKYPKLDYLY